MYNFNFRINIVNDSNQDKSYVPRSIFTQLVHAEENNPSNTALDQLLIET